MSEYQQYVSVVYDDTDVTEHHKDYTYGVEKGSKVTLKPGDRVVVPTAPWATNQGKGVDQWGTVTRVYDERPAGSLRYEIKPVLGYAPYTFSGKQPIKAPLDVNGRTNRRAALSAAASYTDNKYCTENELLARAERFEDWLSR